MFGHSVEGTQPTEGAYANQDGGGSGGGAGDWIKLAAGVLESGFKFGSSSKELKAAEAQADAMMYSKMFGQEQKTNWLPIVAIAGVLLIGGLVVWRVTGKK